MVEDNFNLTTEPAEVAELWDALLSTIPAEKEKARREGLKIAEELKQEGGHKFDGGGQKMGSIDLATFVRWKQHDPFFWESQANIDRFLADNPQYIAPGYKPNPPPKYPFAQ